MSLHHAAQHLIAQGRGPDNNLVHMSDREVAGLQKIAESFGGTLTRNPETGLPEAGVLDKLMPAIVGAAGAYFGMDPTTTAALYGGLTGIQTGDVKQGLMAGLGAYGGANLMNGVMTAGAGALGPDVSQFASNADKAAAGFKDITGDGGLFSLQAGMPGGTFNSSALMAAAPAIEPMVSKLLTKEQKEAAPGTEQMIRPYTFSANPQTLAAADTASALPQQRMLGVHYVPDQDTSERTWFKPQYTALTPYKAAEGGLMEEPVVRMAQGGISSLGGYAAGGNPRLLKGPGDGMSDNIPAVIGGKQPARLADGEFVVPADVVSHLGNGSTDAGAKQLYQMMDRIRQKRTGKKKQAPEVNTKKVMPA